MKRGRGDMRRSDIQKKRDRKEQREGKAGDRGRESVIRNKDEEE